MSTPTSDPRYAELLRAWLPAVWRERDAETADSSGQGDLDKLLGAFGGLLDALRATIAQRRVDPFPDAQADGRHCQPWLLPYIADLLDVRLVSPDEAGRRAELASAVAWRQRKGTRVAVEQIAEAVGQFEVEVHEGWKRVALTPRVDRPLLPESSYGEAPVPEPATPALRAGHPGLPATTPDLRQGSRALRCAPDHPAAHTSRFGGQSASWWQVHRHGVPCLPGSYQDVSRRTVDLRRPPGDPELGIGPYHPRRVPLFLPPPEGHCSAHALSLNWPPVASWDSFTHEKLRYRREEGYRWNGETVVRHVWTGLDRVPVKLRGVMQLDERAVYRFENLWLDNQLKVSQGAVELDHCAARQLHIGTAERLAPVVDARASLLRKLEVARGLVQLEYVTVLETLLAERLNASDCILMPALRKDTVDNDVPEAGCVRHSRLWYLPLDADPLDPELPNDPNWLAQGLRSALCAIRTNCTTAHPVFLNTHFGQPGCGVLHPASPAAIQGGAEDGGELGAYHEDRHVLRRRAVLDKLAEVLPAGTEALLILDPTLACLPPQGH